MTKRKASAIARRIVHDLFTSGIGAKATRLVLMLEEPRRPPRDLGGWGAASVHALIVAALLPVDGTPNPKR